MSEVKKIPTFSWLIRKAEAMLRKDPEEYKLLRRGKSTKMLKGCLVGMQLQDEASRNVFILKRPDGKAYATISCMKDGKDFYTHFEPEFSATEYRKRMHKFLPLSLPDGVRCKDVTRCEYFNADGSSAGQGYYSGGRRGRSGSVDRGRLVVRDRDGTLVNFEAEVPGSLGRQISIGINGQASPSDLWHCFLPGTCHSKLEWYDSMVPPDIKNYRMVWNKMQGVGATEEIPGPLWDAKKMRLLAAKVHAEAVRMSKKFPHLKVALYPMKQVDLTIEADNFGHPLKLSRFSESLDGDLREDYVLGRDEYDEPILYYLPELVMYWTIPGEKAGQRYIHEVPRCMRVLIPPVGCESLLRGPWNSSPFSRYFRWGTKKHPSHYNMRVVSGKEPQERAYHKLIALKEGTWGQVSIRNTLESSRNNTFGFGQRDADQYVHDWAEKQNVALVFNNSQDTDHHWNRQDPYVSRPEDIFRSIEERELIESLPLC